MVRIIELESRQMAALGVETDGINSVDIYAIPANVLIKDVYCRIAVAGTGTGNIIIGDDDDDNGFVEASDATAAAGTLYGDGIAERGAYQNVNPGTDDGPLPGKIYTASGKEIKMDCSGALTTEAKVDVYWTEIQLVVSE